MPFVSNLPCWRLLCMMFTALVTPRWMSWKVVAGKPIRSLLHRTSLWGRRACAELVFNLADRTAKTEHLLPGLSVPAALLGWTPLFFSNHTVCDGSDRVPVVLANVCFFISFQLLPLSIIKEGTVELSEKQCHVGAEEDTLSQVSTGFSVLL